MKSLLSKPLFPVIACIFLSLLLTSCDDKEDDKPDNYVLFNGTKYPISHATLTFNGEADLRHLDADVGMTHYHHSMAFSDGIIDPTNGFSIEGGVYKLTFSVFTTMDDHAADLTSGTFSPVHPQDFFGSKAPLNESFYTFFILRVDDDGNGIFDQGETWYDGLAGEVVINGADNNFTVTFTTDDTDSKSAEGSYVGTFELK